ncbi:MAG: hypothetical protein HOQ24_02365 [Mycobacteriaceae bacterium]|nr:hypothetical protein [Mycobacteriaceae bacterium]
MAQVGRQWSSAYAVVRASAIAGAPLGLFGLILLGLRHFGGFSPRLVVWGWQVLTLDAGWEAAVLAAGLAAAVVGGVSAAVAAEGRPVRTLGWMAAGRIAAAAAVVYAAVYAAVMSVTQHRSGLVTAAIVVAVLVIAAGLPIWPALRWRHVGAPAAAVAAAALPVWWIVVASAYVSFRVAVVAVAVGVVTLGIVAVGVSVRLPDKHGGAVPAIPSSLAAVAVVVATAVVLASWGGEMVGVEKASSVADAVGGTGSASVAVRADGTALGVVRTETTPTRTNAYHAAAAGVRYCDARRCVSADRPLAAQVEADRYEVGLTPTGFVVAMAGMEPRTGIDVFTCEQQNCGKAIHVDVSSEAPATFTDPHAAGRRDGSVVLAYASDRLVRVVVLEQPNASPRVTSVTLAGAPMLDPGSPVVVVDPDGKPVVAVQDRHSGAVYLAMCRDEACRDVRYRRMTASGHEQVAPLLALDSSGAPMVAGFDRVGREITLYSCAAPDCVTVVERRLGRRRAALLWLTVDGDSRPLLVEGASDRRAAPWVYRCAERRCGR